MVELPMYGVVEALMYFGIGFLTACLFALLMVAPIHARAVRLTARRLRLDIPRSAAHMRADKDLLRAEFAMSTRRLENKIARLEARMALQLSELGRRTVEIGRLKRALAEKREPAPDAPRGAAGERAPRADGGSVEAPRERQRSLAHSLAGLARLNPDLDTSPLVPHLDEIDHR